MKSREKAIFTAAAILTAVLCISGNLLAYSGGTGDPNDPYQIANVADLNQLTLDPNNWNKSFILTEDIDLDPNLPGGQVFTQAIIAPDTNLSGGFQGTAFTGTFDGKGHKISNLTINPTNDYIGVFGYIGTGGSVKNLGVWYCSVRGTHVGGLIGYNYGGSISNCYSTGSVGSWSDMWVGGLVGVNRGSISNCYSTCTIRGSDLSSIGGLVGYNYTGSISDCYSTGTVSGSGGSYVGGLVGYNYTGSSISNSFWDTDTSMQTNSAGGTGETTVQMKTESTFTSAGWDFTTIWRMRCEGMNYPKLNWQVIPTADWVCPDGVDSVDFAYFAVRWLNTDCAGNNNCDGADFDFSGTVDIADLKIFCNNWLVGI